MTFWYFSHSSISSCFIFPLENALLSLATICRNQHLIWAKKDRGGDGRVEPKGAWSGHAETAGWLSLNPFQLPFTEKVTLPCKGKPTRSMAETASDLQLVLSLAFRVCHWKVGEHGQKKLTPKGVRKESGNSEKRKKKKNLLWMPEWQLCQGSLAHLLSA